MDGPKELSLSEIRQYMLDNGCKVTNHSLVKHFKRFLTHPDTQIEARKEFKTYVNILATIKNENNQKYLILRKKYLIECPSEDVVQRAISQAGGSDAVPGSPGGLSITSEEATASPFRKPPPYVPPPEVSASVAMYEGTPLAPMAPVAMYEETPLAPGIGLRADSAEKVGELQSEDKDSDTLTPERNGNVDNKSTDMEEKAKKDKSVSRANSVDESANKENIPRFSFSSGSSSTDSTDAGPGAGDKSSGPDVETENPISVKEATRKFNRMASEEEARIISPPSKKKPEKLIEEKELPEVTLAHPKAKEWIVAMAKASYQELAKLANDHPELVKLQDPTTGYTALHWGAKHGNEDVIKLIAGTYKADVNARTNGGYTPLHIAMQFGRVNIFALLCNTYKANRDLLDWAGNKALDYSKQQTTVSASTYSKIKAKRKPTVEKDSGFLRIGSLNVRVKKTTEAFSNFLGVGNGNGNSIPVAAHHHHPHAASTASLPHQRPHRHHHYPHHLHHAGMMRNQHHLHPMMMKKSSTMVTKKTTPSSMHHRPHLAPGSRASAPINTKQFDMLHKSWGSADNITQNSAGTTTNNSMPHHAADDDDDDDDESLMPPPKGLDSVKKRQKNANRSSIASNATDSPRDSISSTSSSNFNSGYSSMPTTPNQLRSPLGLGGVAHNLNGDSDSDSACGFDSNWSINGRSSHSSSGNLKSSKY